MEREYKVVSRLNGGIGNQAFQLAAGLFLSTREERKLVLDESGISHLNTRKLHTSRARMIDVLFPSVTVANMYEVESLKCSVVGFGAREGASPLGTLAARILAKAEAMKPERSYLLEGSNCEDLFDVTLRDGIDAYLSGYWQDFRYADAVRGQLLQSYSTGGNFLRRNSELNEVANELRQSDAAVIHVRRSDFIGKYKKQRSVTSLGYFMSAMRYLENKGVGNFYVFSDDVPWCAESFGNKKRIFFPGGFCGSDSEELWLMSQATNFIISNSSFSWWAAWISSAHDKTIIRPSAWTASDNGARVFPPDWVTVV